MNDESEVVADVTLADASKVLNPNDTENSASIEVLDEFWTDKIFIRIVEKQNNQNSEIFRIVFSEQTHKVDQEMLDERKAQLQDFLANLKVKECDRIFKFVKYDRLDGTFRLFLKWNIKKM